MGLPYLTTTPPIHGVLKSTPEDFEVEEVPAYSPSGSGDHVFAWIEKRGVSTKDAVRRLCSALGVDSSGAGWAGLKDKHAVTRQWISLTGTTPEAVRGVQLDEVRVLEAAAHGHKLRTGHLRANRFSIRIREFDVARIDDVRSSLKQIETHGLPNFYGEQRFGRDGDNADRAAEWVRGNARAPKNRFRRKLEISALQSELFNRAVALRVQTSTLGKVSKGDVVKKHDTGGLFVVEDSEEVQARADAWELSATGPMFGAKMRSPEGEPFERERALLDAADLTPDHFARWKRIAPGSRRLVRVPVANVACSVSDRTLQLDFTLPAGSYATILTREILKGDAPAAESGYERASIRGTE
jgi:tRNA pseudouridine13 synthase